MAGPENKVLGSSSGLIELSTSTENREMAFALAGQATVSVDIVSRHLDPPIYDQAPFIEPAACRIWGILAASCIGDGLCRHVI